MNSTIIRFPEDLQDCITLPDGQRHFKYNNDINSSVIVLAKVRNSNELIDFCMLVDILRSKGAKEIHGKFLYLTAGRMDRAIDITQPFTLRVVTSIINSLNLSSIQVFCPHSSTTLNLLNGGYATNIQKFEESFYEWAIKLTSLSNQNKIGIVIPDDGAAKRWNNGFAHLKLDHDIIYCSKTRDMQTGKLNGFKVYADKVPQTCLIIDDLIDGGATFTGLSKELRQLGANIVELAVCHAILSKGPQIPFIDHIYATDSFSDKYNDVVSYWHV